MGSKQGKSASSKGKSIKHPEEKRHRIHGFCTAREKGAYLLFTAMMGTENMAFVLTWKLIVCASYNSLLIVNDFYAFVQFIWHVTVTNRENGREEERNKCGR